MTNMLDQRWQAGPHTVRLLISGDEALPADLWEAAGELAAHVEAFARAVGDRYSHQPDEIPTVVTR